MELLLLASDCFAEFYTRAGFAGLNGRRNPHTYTYTSHKSIYLYLLFLGGVRAQLKSLHESRLTCFAIIIQPFQIQCSSPLSPPLSWSSHIAIPERDILELKDIYELLIRTREKIWALVTSDRNRVFF